MAWTGRTPIHQFHKMAGNDLVTTPDFAAWVDSIELWGVDDQGLVTSVRSFWEPP